MKIKSKRVVSSTVKRVVSSTVKRGGPGSGPHKGGGADVVEMSPDSVEPVNEITDQDKYEKLVESMKDDGWKGDPILAFEGGNGMQALTGSHRIYAAREAGLEEIPVSVVNFDRGENDYDTFEADMEDFNNASSDEDILDAFDSNEFVEKGYITEDQYGYIQK